MTTGILQSGFQFTLTMSELETFVTHGRIVRRDSNGSQTQYMLIMHCPENDVIIVANTHSEANDFLASKAARA